MTRTSRCILTYVSGTVSQAAILVVGIVTTPLLLRWLGEERYGAFRVTVDWLGYLTLLELGLGGALCPLFARAIGRADAREIHQTVAAGVKAYSWVSLAALIVGLGLGIGITRLIPVSPGFAGDLRWGWLVTVLGLTMLPLAPFRVLVEASQKGYWLNALSALQMLQNLGLGVLFAWAGWGITGQCLALLLAAIVFQGTLAWHAARNYPGILSSALKGIPHRQAWQQLWELNVPTLVRQICFQVSLLSDGILVALILGPQMVVPLFVTQRLALLAQAQLRGIGGASWAALSEVYVQGRRDAFNARLIELTTIVAVLGLGVLLPIVAYNEHFVARWVGERLYGTDLLTWVTAANAYLLAIFTLWNWCLVGTGQVRRLVAVSILSTGINLTVSLLLIRPLGMVGPVLGTLVAFLTTSVWYLPGLLHRVFGTPTAQLIRSVTLPLAVAAPYAAGVWWIAHSHEPRGWLGLLAEMAAAALIYLALAWVAVFNAGDRAGWIGRVRSLLRLRQMA